jgi:hypothetical protein
MENNENKRTKKLYIKQSIIVNKNMVKNSRKPI